MKITAVLLFVCCMQVSATGLSQSITWSGKSVPLADVLSVIKKQTGLLVFANQKQISKAKPVTIDAQQMPLKEFLEKILADQQLTFNIEGNTISVKELKPAADLSSRLNLSPPPITVRGRILNEKGEPVFATISLKGSNSLATTTDSDGVFILNGIEENAVLEISGVNIETQTVRVNKRTEITVAVLTKVTSEEEVVINGGYYKTTDRTKTGNISKVTAKEIEKQPVTSPLLALQGRVPGLEITPQSGVAGGGLKIRVRGQNSLRMLRSDFPGVNSDGGLPLYIIDGVQVNSALVGSLSSSVMDDGYDPLSTLNPANIESVEVLKDADATSIYGSRGANGVILITTKQAKRSDKTSFDFTAYAGGGKIPKFIDLLNREQYLQMRREAFANDGLDYTDPSIFYLTTDLTLWDTTKNTDWQKELIGGTAKTTDITGAVSGGNGTTSYRLGAGYHKETTVYPGDFGYKRTTVFLSVNHQSPDSKFTSFVSINYGVDHHKQFSGGLVTPALTLSVNAPRLHDENGNLNWETHPVYLYSTFHNNPLASTKIPFELANNSLAANTNLQYNFFKGLALKMNLGYNRLDGEESIKTTFASINPDNRYSAASPFGSKPSVTFGMNKRESVLLEPSLNYSRVIKQHVFNIVAGTMYQESKSRYQQIQGSEYTSDALLNSIDAAPVLDYMIDNFAETKYASVFGRVSYKYSNKYLLNINARRDGSSRFGPGNRYGNFGSVAGAWIFTEENFWRHFKHIINFGKLRGSYGVAGNDQVGDYAYYNLYRLTAINYQNETSLTPNSLLSSDLAWEKTVKAELALELSFFDNRINAEIAKYRNRSSNQLVQYPLPGTAGFNYVYANFDALIENSGWEFLIRTENIKTRSFSWTTSFNLTLPRNKLVSFDGIESSPYAKFFKIGEPLSIRRLYRSEGVDPATGIYTFTDINNDGLIDDNDRQFMKPDMQKYYGGLLNSFRYKGFDLSFLIQFTNRTGVIHSGSQPGANNQITNVLARWRKPGDLAPIQKYSQQSFGEVVDAYNNYLLSDDNFGNTSFIRLKTLSLSYTLPHKLFSTISGPSLFLQGQNLFTITDFPGLDPETGYALPPLKMVTLGVQFKL